MRDWSLAPFVGVKVVSAELPCPEDFPDDVIYDIWPGTRQRCDCLEWKDRSNVFLDTICDKEGDPAHRNDACYDVAADPP